MILRRRMGRAERKRLLEPGANKLLHTTPVVGCARCGGDHSSVLFAPLWRAIDEGRDPPLTHWALCPIFHEPILMRFE